MIVKSIILLALGTVMLNILSRLMEISSLKTVFRNIENSQRNWRKPLEKQEITHYVFCQHLGTETIFSKSHFCDRFVFNWSFNLNEKNSLLNFFFKFLFIFLRIHFSTVFRRFLCDFSIFLKTGFSTEIHINRDRVVFIHNCAQRWKYKDNDDYWS